MGRHSKQHHMFELEDLSDATPKEFLSPLGIKLYTYNLFIDDFNLSVVAAHG